MHNVDNHIIKINKEYLAEKSVLILMNLIGAISLVWLLNCHFIPKVVEPSQQKDRNLVIKLKNPH